MLKNHLLLLVPAAILLMSCTATPSSSVQTSENMNSNPSPIPDTSLTMETATFGGGCFWCIEAIFQQVEGVVKVSSGYMGGQRENPTYEQVCSGATGHAEVVQVVYDPAKVSFVDLLEIFWGVHDPTTLNRQGADVGTQYRSVVFYHSTSQRQLAEEYKMKLDASGAFNDPVVTEISPASNFYVAENYHQNYYNENGGQPYCSIVIRPKLEKFKKVFAKKLKH